MLFAICYLLLLFDIAIRRRITILILVIFGLNDDCIDD